MDFEHRISKLNEVKSNGSIRKDVGSCRGSNHTFDDDRKRRLVVSNVAGSNERASRAQRTNAGIKIRN